MSDLSIIRSTRSFRKLREAAREALRAVHALEEASGEVDVFGRYVLGPEEQYDTDEVFQFLYLAREMHPHQELTLIVTAREGEDKEEHSGTEGKVRRDRTD